MWSFFVHSFLAVAVSSVEYQYSTEWQKWKVEHNKSFLIEAEEIKRHSVWLTNKEYIDTHNSNADAFGYMLSMNQFGDYVRTNDKIQHYI